MGTDLETQMDNQTYRLRFTPTEMRRKTDDRQLLRERRSKGVQHERTDVEGGKGGGAGVVDFT